MKSATASILGVALLVASTASAFQPSHPIAFRRAAASASSSSSSSSTGGRTTATTDLHAKGFGSPAAGGGKKKKEKSAGQVEREKAADRYDEIAEMGGQEYNVFVRQFGGDDKSWLPCGSIAVPRAAQVSDAIFSNVDPLKKAIVRTYPKLQGFEDEFEFGTL
jgi:hypothetical protein